MASPATKILVVDDDANVLQMVSATLARAGHEVQSFSNPQQALAAANDPAIDLVVSDIQIAPDFSGLEVLKAFKKAQPSVEVIMITGYGTIDLAVEAVKLGAFDFLTKPFERADFVLRVEKAIEHRRLRQRAERAEAALETRAQFEGLIGQSSQMQAVYKLVDSVSHSSSTVLIRGESGTGKELVARAIHDRSPRRKAPFLAVNCSALTETLVESELFGHARGAFTGALSNRKGLFEMAHTGTIFLDEIGDVSPATQVRLLRVLQEGKIKRVGETEEREIDVRVIAATHVDLEKARQEGTFREDLFYRLNVIALHLPVLRDRVGDVPLLAQHFLGHYARKSNKAVTGISPAAMERLMSAPWVGNVRELENAIERAVVVTGGTVIDVGDLPTTLGSRPLTVAESTEDFALVNLPFSRAKAMAVTAFERRYLTTVMERNGQKVSAAALAAGMDRSNFRRLLKDHGLRGTSTPGDAPEPEQ